MTAPPALRLIPTEDGSLACYDEAAGEATHNLAGALTEALTHYARPADLPGWLAASASAPRPLVILDACFGLGYNTWALLLECQRLAKRPVSIRVIGVEQNPEMLTYIPQILSAPMLEPLKSISTSLEHNIYYQTLNNSQEEAVSISTTLITDSGAPLDLTLDLLIEDLRQSLACHPVLARLAVDFVCHDAYSPNRAPELWTQDVFAQYFERLKARNGRVLTYSTAAAVGGGLRAAGFHVYRSAGLGRKSGGTVASVAPLGEFPSQTGIRTLTGEEETILASRSGLPYRDPALQETRDSVTRQRALAQAASSRAPRPARSLRQETRPRVPAEDTGPDGPSF